MAQFSAKQFTYDKKAKEFAAEVSELSATGENLAQLCVFHQVYSDSCDQGITLVSHITGQESDWAVANETKDVEGETMLWVLEPTFPSLRKFPALSGHRVIIFND